MNDPAQVACRRCGRPLRSALAVAARTGARCAQLALLDASSGPQKPAASAGTAPDGR